MAGTNPYLNGRTTERNRYLDLAQSAKNWRLYAAITTCSLLLASSALCVLVTQRKVQVIFARVDDKFQIRETFRAGEQQMPTEETALVGAELGRWIRQAREINFDWDVQKREYAIMWSHVSGAAQETLKKYYAEHDPRAIAQTARVSVDVTSITRVNQGTWSLRWQESKYAKLTGDLIDKQEWEAFLTVNRKPVTDDMTALANPLGVEIVALSWRQGLPAITTEQP